jgi:hypothetical protein
MDTVWHTRGGELLVVVAALKPAHGGRSSLTPRGLPIRHIVRSAVAWPGDRPHGDQALRKPESTVNANVYVIMESCLTFGNTSTPPDEAPLRSGCVRSTFKPRRK